MKNLSVILAFHAHYPNKDLANQILQETNDTDLKKAVYFENILSKHAAQLRDTFLALIQLSKNFAIPLCLAASNEILIQLKNIAPETATKLREAYRDKCIYPILDNAYEAHVFYTTPEEMIDELRMNEEYLSEVMEVPLTKYKGFFPPEAAVDNKKIEKLTEFNIKYIFFPHLKGQNVQIIPPTNEVNYTPLMLDAGIYAFPRNYEVSQGLWHVLTRLKPEWAALQGYLLGEYFVFEEEYLNGQYLKYPITLQEAINEYTDILRKVVQEAPDNGLVVSMQNLDLMDFGEWALGIIGASWQNIVFENIAQINFVNPEQLIDREWSQLPKLKFDEICWYPESRVILNIDGQYPPLGVTEYNNYKLGERIWKKWPFIFWESGRFLITVLRALMSNFKYPVTIKNKVRELLQQNLLRLDLLDQIALNFRLIKRADNWMWSLDEDPPREAFLHAYYMCKKMLETRQEMGHFERITDEGLIGLEGVLEIVITQRINLLLGAIKKMEMTRMTSFPMGYSYLNMANVWKDKAIMALKRVQELNKGGKNIKDLILQLQEFCKSVFLALDFIKKTTKEIPDRNFVYNEIYKQLYKTFPPKLITVLEGLLYR